MTPHGLIGAESRTTVGVAPVDDGASLLPMQPNTVGDVDERVGVRPRKESSSDAAAATARAVAAVSAMESLADAAAVLPMPKLDLEYVRRIRRRYALTSQQSSCPCAPDTQQADADVRGKAANEKRDCGHGEVTCATLEDEVRTLCRSEIGGCGAQVIDRRPTESESNERCREDT